MDEKQFHDVMKKLDEITTLLRALAFNRLEEAKKRLLSSEVRKKIYNFMNGKRSVQDIARIVHTTDRNVQMFVDTLENAGLIEVIKVGKTRYPKKL